MELQEVKERVYETVLKECIENKNEVKLSNSFIGNRNMRYLEKYLTMALTALTDVANIEVFCASIPGGHHVNCNVAIYYSKKTSTTRYYVIFNLQELFNNCSSAVIHHFSGSTLVDSSTEGFARYDALFNKQEDFDDFILFIEGLMKSVCGYTNMFYNPSNGSPVPFRNYCAKYCKELDKFINNRNGHEIIYYSKRLD